MSDSEFVSQLEILKFGVSEITPIEEFKKMLNSSIEKNKPLIVKCGIDPTGYDIHLGHLVPYKKMRQFQDLGHKGVVIIGDYTASIGDPTGRNESRPSLTKEQVSKNAEKYLEQVFTVLDKNKTEVKFQSEWFNDASLRDVISWTGQTTVAKLLGHETFRDRLDEGHSLSLHELLYPVLQGIDSVYIKADVELGGSDQKFNVLMGRDYQKFQGQRPQVAMLLPIILGTCGSKKMSKSFGNYIGILDEPFDKFGKIMSIPDNLMLDYFKYLTDISLESYEATKKGLKDGSLHPNIVKKNLAEKIVSFFHGDKIGTEMCSKFEKVFSKRNAPDDTPEVLYDSGTDIISIILSAKVISSKGEGRRLIKQNAIGVLDGSKITDSELKLDNSYDGKIIKIGKRRFLKLVLNG